MRKILTWMWLGGGLCALVLGLAISFGVHAQTFVPAGPPNSTIGCAYNSSPPTLTTGTAGQVQCDSIGRLTIVTTPASQLPAGATPILAASTGTTAAVTASLAGTTGKTTYICGFTIDSYATTSTTGAATITGLLTATQTREQNVGTIGASISTWHDYSPCIPASATNTAIAVNSIAAGAGGNTAVNAWGYQQ